jgi:hypothetical protein
MLHWKTKLVTLAVFAVALAAVFGNAKSIGIWWV